MSAFAIPTREPAETILPTDANAVGGNPGASWAWSSWVQVTASLANDFILTGAWWLQVFNQNAASVASTHVIAQYEVGIGGAGAETVIAQGMTIFHATYTHVAGALVQMGQVFWLPFEPVRIPAGTRVAIRMTTNNASSTIFLGGSYLCGYEDVDGRSWPLDKIVRADKFLEGLYSRAGAVRSKVTPDAAAGIAVTSTTTAFSFGSWAEVLAAASVTRPLILKAVSVETDSSVSIHGNLQIGLGAAGSENPIATIGMPGRTAQLPSAHGLFPLARPKLVLPGERIAVRLKTSGVAAKTHNVWLAYDEIA